MSDVTRPLGVGSRASDITTLRQPLDDTGETNLNVFDHLRDSAESEISRSHPRRKTVSREFELNA